MGPLLIHGVTASTKCSVPALEHASVSPVAPAARRAAPPVSERRHRVHRGRVRAHRRRAGAREVGGAPSLGQDRRRAPRAVRRASAGGTALHRCRRDRSRALDACQATRLAARPPSVQRAHRGEGRGSPGVAARAAARAHRPPQQRAFEADQPLAPGPLRGAHPRAAETLPPQGAVSGVSSSPALCRSPSRSVRRPRATQRHLWLPDGRQAVKLAGLARVETRSIIVRGGPSN